jgi:hypothetical protein
MHGCNKKIVALTDQLSRLNLLTHLDNGFTNPIPILTQGKTPLKDVLRPIAYLLLWIVGITKKNKV